VDKTGTIPRLCAAGMSAFNVIAVPCMLHDRPNGCFADWKKRGASMVGAMWLTFARLPVADGAAAPVASAG